MNLTSNKIKKTLTKLTETFRLEKNIFQKFVIIHKYIDYLNKTPLTKEVLQKIFEDTATTMNEIYENLPKKAIRNKVRGKKFWMYYSDLEMIHDTMGDFKDCKTMERTEFDKLCLDFSEPYSEEILELSFKVVNSHVFNWLDRKSFFTAKARDGKTWFDSKRSVLYIDEFKIKISEQSKETNAHKILKHIFSDNRDNINDNFFFSEMAEDVFEDLEYKADRNSWQRYYDTCKRINEKIKIKTKNVVNKFLIFNSGQKGYLRVNSKYL